MMMNVGGVVAVVVTDIDEVTMIM